MRRVHKTTADLVVDQGRVLCQNGELYDRWSYSRFKYGHTLPAQNYGFELARLIEDELIQTRDGRPTIIVSAPYKFVPTASHGIALAMRRALAPRFIKEGVEPPVVVPFHKARTGSGAYAKSDHQSRLASLATLGLSIDERLVTGANVLVVDDIRITGAAQASTASFLEALNPHSVWYLHAARLSEQDAATNPGLEDELNQTVSKDLTTILTDIRAGEFMLNARVLGFIMKATDPDAFVQFVQDVPDAMLVRLYEATLCSGPAYVARFPDSLQLIEYELQLRGIMSALANFL